MPGARRRRIDATIAQLRALLPPDWSVSAAAQEGDVTLLRIADASGTESALPLLTTDRLEPREIRGRGSLPRVGRVLGSRRLASVRAISCASVGRVTSIEQATSRSASAAPVSTSAPKVPP